MLALPARAWELGRKAQAVGPLTWPPGTLSQLAVADSWPRARASYSPSLPGVSEFQSPKANLCCTPHLHRPPPSSTCGQPGPSGQQQTHTGRTPSLS